MSDEYFDELQARLDQEEDALVARYNATPREALEQMYAPELGAPVNFWDVIARGPWQAPGLEPGRIIQVGEEALIRVVVILNANFPAGQSACDIITGFGAKIQLNMFTSNMQTMTPEPNLSDSVCIDTVLGQCRYRHTFRIRPQTAACLYETNICARICNCDGSRSVPQFAAFVRWVRNLDFDLVFGAPRRTFDNPIRYMVADLNGRCCP
jgi:hypothetical protein